MISKFNEKKFYKLIHKMNEQATPCERIQWNRFKCDLWECVDAIRDMTRSADSTRLSNKVNELYDFICKLPILED